MSACYKLEDYLTIAKWKWGLHKRSNVTSNSTCILKKQVEISIVSDVYSNLVLNMYDKLVR